MLSDLDNFYLGKDEPLKSCLLALREIILSHDAELVPVWKYRMPFFCYKDKMFCYLWVRNKTNEPYIGFVDGNKINHPMLIQEKRSRMKIMLVDADADLPVKEIKNLLKTALELRGKG